MSDPSSNLPSESNPTPTPTHPAIQAQTKKLKRLYITLILVGFAIGGVVSIGVVALMRHFELTQAPRVESGQ